MAASMSRIAKERMGNATSIFNLMRNIGGSTGIAVMTTFLARRNQLHNNHLIAHITPGDVHTREMLEGMRTWFFTHGADNYTATRKALAALYGQVQRHAAMLSFVEAFWVMGVLFLIMLPLVALLRNPRAPLKERGRHAELKSEIAAGSLEDRFQEEEDNLLVGHR